MTLPQGQNNINNEEPEEVDVYPLDPRAHSDEHQTGFCYDPTCPCHEDGDNIQELGQAVQDGEVTVEEADMIYHGRTV